jgi:nicotinate phosphoribosyltransferase
MAAGRDKKLYEFGLRQAQGPDGAISASRYAYIGGFDSTSNVTASKIFGIPLHGSFGHAYVSSFDGLETLNAASTTIDGTDILPLALRYRSQLNKDSNIGELAAFVCYAASFPNGFLALVDTYVVFEREAREFQSCFYLKLSREYHNNHKFLLQGNHSNTND